jgi:hypothetical protein
MWRHLKDKFPETMNYVIVERWESHSCCYIRQDLLYWDLRDAKQKEPSEQEELWDGEDNSQEER